MERPTARKGQQFACQRRRSIGLFADTVKSFQQHRVVTALIDAQFRPAKDRSDDIIEIVGDTPGKLADSLKLLCLMHLAFRRAPCGDVLYA